MATVPFVHKVPIVYRTRWLDSPNTRADECTNGHIGTKMEWVCRQEWPPTALQPAASPIAHCGQTATRCLATDTYYGGNGPGMLNKLHVINRVPRLRVPGRIKLDQVRVGKRVATNDRRAHSGEGSDLAFICKWG